MRENRVVVTGLGVIAANGNDIDSFWEATKNGVSGIREVSSFDTSGMHAHLAAEVSEFRPADHCRRESPEKMGRASHLAIAAARQALAEAGVAESGARQRTGVVVGTTVGEGREFEHAVNTWIRRGYRNLSARDIHRADHSQIANHVAAEFDLLGPSLLIATACSAGNYAIGYAGDLIRLGRADVMVAGGVEPFSQIPLLGFGRLGAIAPEMCQPFDVNRKGAIFGEGAGFLVLESYEHARRRGAQVHAEFRGYALSCDAYHPTAPDPAGSQAARMIREALANGEVNIDEVDFISAHGTGTKANDRVESKVIRDVFGERARLIPVTSIKSMIGHTMGAAAAIEAVACVKSIVDGVVPPTINHYETDPVCEVDVVANTARETPVRMAVNNSFAFGGNNACTVFSHFN